MARERGVRVSPRIVLLGTLEQVAAAADGSAATAAVPGAVPGAAPAAAPAAGPVAVPPAGSDPARPASGLFGRLRNLLGGAA